MLFQPTKSKIQEKLHILNEIVPLLAQDKQKVRHCCRRRNYNKYGRIHFIFVTNYIFYYYILLYS